jgi:hypothetical protein
MRDFALLLIFTAGFSGGSRRFGASKKAAILWGACPTLVAGLIVVIAVRPIFGVNWDRAVILFSVVLIVDVAVASLVNKNEEA